MHRIDTIVYTVYCKTKTKGYLRGNLKIIDDISWNDFIG